MSETASPVRRGRLRRFAAALLVLLALAGYVAVRYVTGGSPPGCVVRASEKGGAVYRLTAEQADNAATIAAVGTTRGMPQRAVTIALATALQESALRNITYGDRDSLGLFQQRPSQGWGTPKQILDPVYSAGIFYDHLAEVPGYSRLPLTVAAQRVQRSGFPQAYAKHEPDATLLSAALTGGASAALSCSVRPDGRAGDASAVQEELTRAFGPGVLPPSAPAAGAPGSSVLSVPVDQEDPDGADRAGGADRRGWELAHWAVARSDTLRVAEVSYAGRVWSSDRAVEGWRAQRSSQGDDTDSVRIRVASPGS
ncbi:hypothetical protein [Streptomyces sp. NPDC090029]|uniref:hypothetical protein n=1 Tax=Streptomyces sp. NPDC090029 TaxID=3365924 RepID=UPI00382B3D44